MNTPTYFCKMTCLIVHSFAMLMLEYTENVIGCLFAGPIALVDYAKQQSEYLSYVLCIVPECITLAPFPAIPVIHTACQWVRTKGTSLGPAPQHAVVVECVYSLGFVGWCVSWKGQFVMVVTPSRKSISFVDIDGWDRTLKHVCCPKKQNLKFLFTQHADPMYRSTVLALMPSLVIKQ